MLPQRVTYTQLPEDKVRCEEMIHSARRGKKRLPGGDGTRDYDFHDTSPGKQDGGEDASFFGPFVNFRTTSGERQNREAFFETTLLRDCCIGEVGYIRARCDNYPRSPASGNVAAHVELEAEHYIEGLLKCEGSPPDSSCVQHII
jgi:hypothetical protein